jgi:hypothetical protein
VKPHPRNVILIDLLRTGVDPEELIWPATLL